MKNETLEKDSKYVPMTPFTGRGKNTFLAILEVLALEGKMTRWELTKRVFKKLKGKEPNYDEARHFYLFRQVKELENISCVKEYGSVKSKGSENPLYGLTFRGILYAIHREILSPSEVGKVENLDPVLETASFYRSWKISPERDERQFTTEEKERVRSLYEKVACFLPYFPDYHSWKIKTFRNIGLEAPLSSFFTFCINLIRVCWSLKDFVDDEVRLLEHLEREMTIKTNKKNPWLEVAEHLNKDPYRYVHDAYVKKDIKPSDIVTLGSFSKHGYRDIYFRESFLQELHLLEMSLRSPLDAYIFLDNIETLRAMIWEEKIQLVSVKALSEAITNKGREESLKIANLELRQARQRREKYRTRPLEEYQAEVRKEQELQKQRDKREAEEALRQIIEVSDLDITEDELEEALVNYATCQSLQHYIDSHCGKLNLKLKDKIA